MMNDESRLAFDSSFIIPHSSFCPCRLCRLCRPAAECKCKSCEVQLCRQGDGGRREEGKGDRTSRPERIRARWCAAGRHPRPPTGGRQRHDRKRDDFRKEDDTMDGKGIRLLAGASLLLGLAVSTGRAEEPVWRSVSATPPAAHAPAPPGPAASIGRPEPLATLGRPVPVGQPADAVDPPFVAGAAAVRPANFSSANTPAVLRCDAPGDVQPVQLSRPPPVPPPPPPSRAPFRRR